MRSKRASQSGSRAERTASRPASRRSEFGGQLLLAGGHAGADTFELGGQQFHLGAGLRERGFLGFSALQARIFFIFQAVGFGGFELDLVLDGCGLRGRGDGVELGAEAGGLLAVGVDLALQAGAQRVFAVERGRGLGGLALGGGERGLGLGDFRGQTRAVPGSGGRGPARWSGALRGFQSALASMKRRIRHWGTGNKGPRKRGKKSGLRD